MGLCRIEILVLDVAALMREQNELSPSVRELPQGRYAGLDPRRAFQRPLRPVHGLVDVDAAEHRFAGYVKFVQRMYAKAHVVSSPRGLFRKPLADAEVFVRLRGALLARLLHL